LIRSGPWNSVVLSGFQDTGPKWTGQDKIGKAEAMVMVFSRADYTFTIRLYFYNFAFIFEILALHQLIDLALADIAEFRDRI
jgi:hypothetical protein